MPIKYEVLLIEDSNDDAMLVKANLRRSDSFVYRIDWANNLKSGLNFLKNKNYDILILDLILPDSKGLSTFKTIFEYSPTLPIIILTGLQSIDLAMDALAHGAQDYISKDDLQGQYLERTIRYSIERKRLENKLLELNATKDKFFSIVAHDLRGPFNSFLGMLKVFADETEDFDPEEIKSMAQRLYESAEALYELLNNLLEWSKIQRGLFKVNREELSLNKMVEDVFKGLQLKAFEKNIVLENLIKEDLTIFADENMIKSVLQNLITNALKFTENNGQIKVHIRPSQETKTEIHISDSGVGMEEEVLKNLWRIDYSHTTPGTKGEKGSGLGLILCKEFIEKNDGQIWAESKVGKGSTFAFTLPLSPTKIRKEHLTLTSLQ